MSQEEKKDYYIKGLGLGSFAVNMRSGVKLYTALLLMCAVGLVHLFFVSRLSDFSLVEFLILISGAFTISFNLVGAVLHFGFGHKYERVGTFDSKGKYRKFVRYIEIFCVLYTLYATVRVLIS